MKRSTFLSLMVILLVAVLGAFALQVLGVLGKTQISPNWLLLVIIAAGFGYYFLKKKAEKEPWFGKKRK